MGFAVELLLHGKDTKRNGQKGARIVGLNVQV